MQALARHAAHQLTHAGDLEGRALDQVGQFIHRQILRRLFKCCAHDTGAADTDIDHAVSFAYAMESARHERIVFRRVAEDDDLGRADAVARSGQLTGLLHRFAHHAHRIHVDAGLCAAHIDRGADVLGLRHRFWDRLDQRFISGGKALLHEGTEAADEVHASFLRALFQRQRIFERIAAAHADEHGDRRHRDPLVDDGDAIFPADVIAHFDQIFGLRGDLLVYLLTGTVDVRVRAVEQRDPHGDRADIQIFLIDHLDGFQHIL